MIEAGNSQVVTYTPAGTQPRVLGALGHVEQLQYSWTNPGGADQLSLLLQVPANFRTDALNPGRQCKVFRGGAVVWDGKLLEPSVDSTGWQVTAAGIGSAGTDFMAFYANPWGTVTQANEVLDRAITRGLRWQRNAAVPSGVWFGQVVDPASITVTDFLNLLCTKGTYTWYVTTGNYGNVLSVYSFPQNPVQSQATRLLVSNTPVARTLGGDYDFLYLRYQTSADAATTATYATTTVSVPADITAHGQVESYDDLSSSGQQVLGTIQAAGQATLNRYQRASFAGPFTIRYGELLTKGGAPCDLGIDHCGQIAQLILTDFGYGGEVVPDPVCFMIGSYAWDETAQTAQVAPFQSLDLSMSSLLSELSTVLPPIPAAKPKPKRITLPLQRPRPRITLPLQHPRHRKRPRRFPR